MADIKPSFSKTKPPIVLGLTGGIGAGKSAVARLFEEQGIPVYYADNRAKFLMQEDDLLVSQISDYFGSEAYENGQLNRPFLAQRIFNSKKDLATLNSFVHPAVKKDFDAWVKAQKTVFVVKEAAILFESGSYQDCDYVLSIKADEEIRIQRVMQRDQSTRDQVLERIRNQWSEAQRIEKSDYVIENNSDAEALKSNFDSFIKKFISTLAK